jgi:DNA-binding NarL/FixJ family response regulator
VKEIRLVLADDHPVFREGLQAVLASAPGIVVVGESESGSGALAMCRDLRPDVVLMDIQMEDLNGIEATRQLVAEQPEVGVLMLTMFEDDESVFAAMRAGARGYLLKGSGRAEILRAVDAAAAGEAIFSPRIATRIRGFFQAQRSSKGAVFTDLTEREREVLDLIAQGLSNPAIARRLSISEKTVRNNVSNIFSKLHFADRAQAIVRSREVGMG